MAQNVLIVTIDALRTDRVGVLGDMDITPELDCLASDGTVFTNAYSTTNATDPAVTSLQTGRYPLSHGVVNHGSQVTEYEKAAVQHVSQLPEVLSESGYHTAKFGRPLGRWHRSGFDIYPDVAEGRTAFDEQSVTLKKRVSNTFEQIHPALRTVCSVGYNTVSDILHMIPRPYTLQENEVDPIIEQFKTFLDDVDGPFYSFVHFMDTHTPYIGDAELAHTFLERFDYPNIPLSDLAERFPEGSPSHERFSPGGHIHQFVEYYEKTTYGVGTAAVCAQYDAATHAADARVGAILDQLRNRNLLDETLIVVLADHGESLTEHDIYFDHHGLYDESLHIPLIIRPPGGAERSRCQSFVQITDIVPTILSYTGVDGISNVDGVSLQDLIEKKEESLDREAIIAEEAHTQRRRAIRTQDKKAIYLLEEENICRYCGIEHAPKAEYYKLTTDPDERKNKATDAKDEFNMLRDRADKIANQYEQQCPSPSEIESVNYEDEDAVHERLEALGYR